MANQQNIEKYKFVKGHKGAGGRPKGSKNASTILKKLLYEGVVEITEANGKKKKVPAIELVCMAQIIKAATGSTKAFNSVMDRVEGKAIQKVEHTGEDGEAIKVATITREMTEQEATQLYFAKLKKNE